jgi:Zn finger protein HypA/HybF involved in hydrogenase expression
MGEKHTHRVSPEIRCIDCGASNAYERCIDRVWDIYCPDCAAVFGWDNIPKQCRGCEERLRDSEELGRGLCPRCKLASYSPEKRAALNKLIGMAFRATPATDAEKDEAIDEAFRHMGEG